MLNCRKITQAISLKEEKNLSWALHLEVQLHLMMCPRCRAFAKNNQKLTELTRQFCSRSASQ